MRGEFYPVKPDIFEATYEPAEPRLTDWEKIKDELLGLHDNIIAIWEVGQQHEDNYGERIDKIVSGCLSALKSMSDPRLSRKEIERIVYDIERKTCASEYCGTDCPAYPENKEYPCGVMLRTMELTNALTTEPRLTEWEKIRERLQITDRALEEFINHYHLGKDTGAVMALRAIIKYNEIALKSISKTRLMEESPEDIVNSEFNACPICGSLNREYNTNIKEVGNWLHCLDCGKVYRICTGKKPSVREEGGKK